MSNKDGKLKPRYGRMIFALSLLVCLGLLVGWALGNADKIEHIQAQMKILSQQLEQQTRLTNLLNSRLGNFSAEMNGVGRSLDDIREVLRDQNQGNEYDLSVIQNDIKNIKSKMDTLLMQSNSNRYYR